MKPITSSQELIHMENIEHQKPLQRVLREMEER
jgi:hypothetical protein